MTSVDMVRAARDIVPPVGATAAIATHDGTNHRAAFVIGGRLRSAPVGPEFAKPRDAIAFVRILNGDRRTGSTVSRSSDLVQRPGATRTGEPDGRLIEAPVVKPGGSVQDPAAASPTAAGVRAPSPARPAAPA